MDPAFNRLLDALAQSNHFSIEELRLNRSGRMSGRQARRLASGLLFRVIFALCLIGGSVVPIILALDFHVNVPPALRTGVCPAVILTVSGMVTFLTGARRIGDIISRRAVAIEGLAEPVRSGSDEHTSYYYRVGGKRLRVGARAYQALIPGITYRVYYAPRSMTLLSVEPLSVSPSPTGEGVGG